MSIMASDVNCENNMSIIHSYMPLRMTVFSAAMACTVCACGSGKVTPEIPASTAVSIETMSEGELQSKDGSRTVEVFTGKTEETNIYETGNSVDTSDVAVGAVKTADTGAKSSDDPKDGRVAGESAKDSSDIEKPDKTESESEDGKTPEEDSAAEYHNVTPDSSDMIDFETDYGKVFITHENGDIINLSQEISEERYHDSGQSFAYHSPCGIRALVPGYYNYYQSDETGYDRFYIFSDSSYPQISFVSFNEGDGEEFTDKNYKKYQDDILDAWELELKDSFSEESRTSFTIGKFKLREAVIRGKLDGKPATACLELLWNKESGAILGIRYFQNDSDSRSYMDDFVTMITDHMEL